MKKRILIIFLLSVFCLCSCYRNMFHSSVPRKGPYIKIEYPGNLIIFDSDDTNSIEKYSKAENFTFIEIIERKEYYDIVVQSDSMLATFDANGDFIDNIFMRYRVISLKTKKIKGYEEIYIGQRCKLTLIPCFYPTSTMPSMLNVHIYIKGMYVPVNTSSMDIYTTSDLEGLYYIRCK